MATHFDPGTSHASGWSVWQPPDVDHRWHWSAYGPRGGSQGIAPSKARAEEVARRECENLKKWVAP